MSTFTWSPSYPASQSVKPRVLKAQFGDGYEQRIGDGINTRPRTWSVQFNNRSKAEIAQIDAFLSASNGQIAFDWTPPTGAAGKWICENWEESLSMHHFSSLSATFREVFEP